MKNNVPCTTQYTVPLQRLPEQTESLLKEIHAFALQTVPILFASCSITLFRYGGLKKDGCYSQ